MGPTDEYETTQPPDDSHAQAKANIIVTILLGPFICGLVWALMNLLSFLYGLLQQCL
jgi:hypothetical protein